MSQKYDLQDRIAKYYPKELKRLQGKIVAFEKHGRYLKAHTNPKSNGFYDMKINTLHIAKKIKQDKLSYILVVKKQILMRIVLVHMEGLM